jgi:hypothetical protein
LNLNLVFQKIFLITSYQSVCEQALDAKRKEDLCLTRKPLVESAVAESKEWASLSFVQQDFVPGLELLVDELSVQSQMIHAAIEEAVPFCKQFLLSIGNPATFESPHDKSSEYSSEFLIQNTSKVRDCSCEGGCCFFFLTLQRISICLFNSGRSDACLVHWCIHFYTDG